MGHRLMGVSLTFTGSIAQGRENFDRAIALYDAHAHGPLATRFGQDPRVASLAVRSWTLWMLGYPEAALKDAERALSEAREIGQAAALMYALSFANMTIIRCGGHQTAKARADELAALAREKGALVWEPQGVAQQGFVLALTGKPSCRRLLPELRVLDQREALPMCRNGWRSWQKPTQSLANSTSP